MLLAPAGFVENPRTIQSCRTSKNCALEDDIGNSRNGNRKKVERIKVPTRKVTNRACDSVEHLAHCNVRNDGSVATEESDAKVRQKRRSHARESNQTGLTFAKIRLRPEEVPTLPPSRPPKPRRKVSCELGYCLRAVRQRCNSKTLGRPADLLRRTES